MKQRLSLWGFCLLSLMTACQIPLDPQGAGGGTGTVLLSLDTGGRTLVPDWKTGIASCEITLTMTGTPDRKATVSSITGTTTVTGLLAGSWSAKAVAFNASGDPVGTGELTGQTVSPGVTLNWTIPITPLQTANGAGSYSLLFRFPSDIDIDFVTGQLFKDTDWTPAGGPVDLASFTVSGAYWQGAFAQTGLPSGAYTLQLTFRRGGASGAVVGTYGEAVNIYDNAVSDQWLSPTAATSTSRTFAAGDFSSSNANLSRVQVALDASHTLLTTPGFSSSVHDYVVYCGDSPVLLTPVESAGGQKIEYRTNGNGPWTANRSGVTTAPLGSSGTTVQVRVTAPDQTTTSVYTWVLKPRLAITFHGNGSTGGLPPTGTDQFLQGESVTVPGNSGLLTKDPDVWGGTWNSEPDGTGASYTAGQTVEVNADLNLYALWVPGLRVFYHANSEAAAGTLPTDGAGYLPNSSAKVLGTAGPAPLSRPGYQFAGWNTAADGSGTTFAWGSDQNQIPLSSADADLWALWLPPDCTFEAGWGSRDNLVLKGWSASPSGTVVIPPGVNALGSGFLGWASAVTGISIPNTVTTVESDVLAYSGLTSLTLPESVRYIGWGAFSSTQLTSLHIPAGLQSLGGGAFGNCSRLTTLTVDPRNTSMELLSGALVDHWGSTVKLTLVPGGFTSPYSIPVGVTSIGFDTFYDSRLTSVLIPEGVVEIQTQAFYGSRLAGTVTLPASLTSVSARSFMASGNLKAFAVDPANPVYSTVTGVLFNKIQTTLIAVPGGYRDAGDVGSTPTTRYTVPEGVVTVAREAFGNCNYLSAITVASTVTKIEYGCFGNVSPYLKELTLLPATPPVLEGDNYDSKITKIHVPSAEAKALYLAAPGWSSIPPSVFVVP